MSRSKDKTKTKIDDRPYYGLKPSTSTNLDIRKLDKRKYRASTSSDEKWARDVEESKKPVTKINKLDDGTANLNDVCIEENDSSSDGCPMDSRLTASTNRPIITTQFARQSPSEEVQRSNDGANEIQLNEVTSSTESTPTKKQDEIEDIDGDLEANIEKIQAKYERQVAVADADYEKKVAIIDAKRDASKRKRRLEKQLRKRQLEKQLRKRQLEKQLNKKI